MYGLMVMLGVVVCNSIAMIISRKKENAYLEFILPTFCGAISAIIGAKALGIVSIMLKGGILNSFGEILDNAGYSYFGGLAAFLFTFWAICKARSIEYVQFERYYLFLIPLLHVFWKIGCFMGGCCFGIPYNGPGAVIFPDRVNSLSGVSVFPVQILEAVGAVLIVIVMIIRRESFVSPLSMLLIMYGLERFVIEFLRYHPNGTWFSKEHVYSVICTCAGVTIRIDKSKKLRSMP